MVEQPKLECDLIMRGGITSGVVYPMAVVELAKSYRFRAIGGTSAGAIAAAVTAAACYGRRHDHDGFEELAALPQQLGQVKSNERTMLMNLFKAEPKTEPLLSLGLALIGHKSGYWGKLKGLWSAFPLGSALGAIIGILPALLLLIALPFPLHAGGWIGLIVALIAALGVAFVGSLIGGLVAALRRASREIPKNKYGICSGKGEADGSKVPALTNWLHQLIQRVAGRDDAKAPPLTFGDLWGTDGDETAERDIELVLMTTNITQGMAHRFPFIDGPGSPFFFNEQEFRGLFPDDIVRWLVEKARPLDDGKKVDCPEGFHCLPCPADLPILLGARMSLSFPFLLSAVPLHAGNFLNKNEEGKATLEPCWFSDGGLTSNFPIHFFDTPLPTRPTFGINLMPNTVTAGEGNGAVENASRSMNGTADADKGAEAWQMVWMPNDNSAGQTAMFNRFERKPNKLISFFGALFDTARNWADSELMRMPGYRDRIVHIRLNDGEGGLNLDMPREVIGDLGKRGALAGKLLTARFSPNVGKDPKTGEDIKLTWDNHRWIRYRATMAALEDLARRFRNNWRLSEDPDTPWEPYTQMIERGVGNAPSYQWANKAQRDHAIKITRAFTQFVDGWQDDNQTFDRTDANSRGRSPRPKSALRIMPPADGDPRGERVG